MNLLLDTNRYRDFVDGDPAAMAALQKASRIHLPFVVLAEMRAGFRCGTMGRENESVLVKFLNRPRVSVLYADEATTHHYGALWAQLRKQGTPIPTNDIWVAALAIQHDLVLFSRDAHFAHLPQVAQH